MKLLFQSGIYLIAFFIFLILCSCEAQESRTTGSAEGLQIRPSTIEIGWELQSNFEEGNTFSAVLTLKNSGSEVFQPRGWALYFNSLRPLVAESFEPYFDVTHINGDFFKLEPTDQFEAIEPAGRVEIPYRSLYHAIKFTDVPQGFYFVFDEGYIESVENVTIAPFEREEQVNRSPSDLVPVPDAGFTFNKNENLDLLNQDQVGKIIPTPKHVQKNEGLFTFERGLNIYHHVRFSNEANYLSTTLLNRFDVPAGTEIFRSDNEGTGIYLVLDQAFEEGSEAYTLDISPGFIRISGRDPAGIFYGVQSLLAYIDNRETDSLEIPSVTIEDSPAFPYRGMHLDVSRNFQSIESVKLLLDAMAMYKLNRFHFHLTDDEGWRLAINRLPELTEVGGRRGHTEEESDYLIPAYGSGPNPATGRSYGSGWYSREEYMDIIQYANNRHIEVIPEIDVPGHARAAIIAMKARAERFSQNGDDDGAVLYRLDEPDDQSQYRSIQNFDDNVINVCRESTYRFLELVINELQMMHLEAGVPLNTIHVGGDEVPQGVWEESPACKALMDAEEIEHVRDLQVYFFERLLTILQDRGIRMAGWEEVVFRENPETGEHFPNPDFSGTTIPHIWSNIWGSGTEDYAYELANMGYEVVMSHASNFYFDFAYNKHWEEPGFYWASMFDAKEPYSFIPFDLYKNAVTDNYGNPIPENQYDDAFKLRMNSRQNILGLQGQLWTETVNEDGRMEYMIFPRLLALAERAWAGNPEWSETRDRDQMWRERDVAWNEFANRIGQFEFNRLDRIYPGINYRLPPPGAIIRDGMLVANSSYPGLEIRYALDDEELNSESRLYEGPVQVDGVDSVKIAVFNSLGRSGSIVIPAAE